MGKWRKSYLGWIRKNPEILPSYHSYDFSLKNDNLGLKIAILKFLGIQPRKRLSDWPEIFSR